MSTKSSNDTIGNRTRDLPACSAVPPPTAPTGAPQLSVNNHIFSRPAVRFASPWSSPELLTRISHFPLRKHPNWTFLCLPKIHFALEYDTVQSKSSVLMMEALFTRNVRTHRYCVKIRTVLSIKNHETQCFVSDNFALPFTSPKLLLPDANPPKTQG